METTRSKRPRHSYIWNYFQIYNDESKVAQCNFCHIKLSFRTTISNLNKHLTAKHSGIVSLSKLRTEELVFAVKSPTPSPEPSYEEVDIKPIIFGHGLVATSSSDDTKGVVLGLYANENKLNNSTDLIFMTEFGVNLQNRTNGQLIEQLKIGHAIKKNETRLFWNLDEAYKAICVVGLGDSCKQPSRNDHLEGIDLDKEATRVAAALGTSALESRGILNVNLDGFIDIEAAAEGATLKSWIFQAYKEKSKRKPSVQINVENTRLQDCLNRGVFKAKAQNFARKLMETPANYMTPLIFCQTVSKKLQNLCDEVITHDLDWIKSQKMGAFLSVAQGSNEAPRFLEIKYKGSNDNPVVLVGKGVTFDSGGISIKPSNKMDDMRGDMGGAATVAATILAVSSLKLPINIVGLIPLCENMPSGSATKPGDVVIAKNGKSIAVDNTDAEGRLILADALCYSGEFNPKCVIDIATLTGAMRMALGDAATGVFSNSDELFKDLAAASYVSGDRVWRMPLFKRYYDLMTTKSGYDINNISSGGKGGGACTAAAFLYSFVPKDTDWMHLDIAGVMDSGATKYLSDSMTGRPVRTLIEFFENAASN